MSRTVKIPEYHKFWRLSYIDELTALPDLQVALPIAAETLKKRGVPGLRLYVMEAVFILETGADGETVTLHPTERVEVEEDFLW